MNITSRINKSSVIARFFATSLVLLIALFSTPHFHNSNHSHTDKKSILVQASGDRACPLCELQDTSRGLVLSTNSHINSIKIEVKQSFFRAGIAPKLLPNSTVLARAPPSIL